MEDQGYYEAMRPEEFPPDPWWLTLIKVLVIVPTSIAVIVVALGAVFT